MSKNNAESIRAARAEAERARKKLESSYVATREALKPQAIASNAWDSMKDLGGGIAAEVADTVKGQPITATAVGAALTVAIAKRPLRWLSSKLSKPKDEAPLVAPPYATDAPQTTFKHETQGAPQPLPGKKARKVSEGVTA